MFDSKNTEQFCVQIDTQTTNWTLYRFSALNSLENKFTYRRKQIESWQYDGETPKLKLQEKANRSPFHADEFIHVSRGMMCAGSFPSFLLDPKLIVPVFSSLDLYGLGIL